MNQFVAVIKTFKYRSPRGIDTEIRMTSLEMVDPNGKDCGVPLYLNGYDEASELLRIAGVSAKDLAAHRPSFESGEEVRFAVSADSYIVEAMGFKPRF